MRRVSLATRAAPRSWTPLELMLHRDRSSATRGAPYVSRMRVDGSPAATSSTSLGFMGVPANDISSLVLYARSSSRGFIGRESGSAMTAASHAARAMVAATPGHRLLLPHLSHHR